MSFRPSSRRLPRALQRSTSPFSRRVARQLLHHGRERRVGSRFAQLLRQSRRMGRTLHLSLLHIRIWCLAAVAASLVALVLFMLFSPLFSVTSIRISREDRRVDIEEIQRLLLPFFGKHILFLSTTALERTVETAYPEVATVRVVKHLPRELRLTLTMDPIIADVIMGEPDATERNLTLAPESASGSGRRYLTQHGIYLEYASPVALTPNAAPGGSGTMIPPMPGGPFLLLHIVDWAVKPVHRQKLIPEDLIANLRNARSILEGSFGHRVRSITYYVRAREFHIQTERLALWFDMATPLLQQIERYRTFLRTLPPDRAQEYIDLRLHDRVIYR